MMILLVLSFLLTAIPCQDAHAYLGPGIATGTFGILLGFLLSIFLALFAVVWYPIKHFFKSRGKKSQAHDPKTPG